MLRTVTPSRRSSLRAIVGATLSSVLIVGALVAAPSAALASSTGSITGTVTGADTGAVQANVNVQLELIGGTPVANATTDAGGVYTFTGLPAGDYVLDFNVAQGSAYANQWYGGGLTLSTATAIPLTDGQALGGLTTALPVGATISGTLSETTATGTVPLANANIVLLDHQNTELGFGNTDSSGHWSIGGVATGSYTLSFVTYSGGYAGQWWKSRESFASADFFGVQAGQTLTGFDATLDGGASISGTVTSADTGSGSTAISQGSVGAYDMTGTQVASATTDASGNYTISGLNPGQYTLEFTGPSTANDAEQWWGNAASQPTATYFSVGSHATLSGYDAALLPGATISGTVVAAAASAGASPTPLENFYVIAIPSTGGFPYSGSTAADGTYSVTGLPAGQYSVFFDASGFAIPQANQWWNDSATQGGSTPLTVATGQTVTAVNATLGLGATISGTVSGLTRSGGVVPAQNATVDLYSADGNIYFNEETYVNGDGTFSLVSIPPGSYTLKFSPQGDTTDFQTEWWKNQPLQSNATYFTLTAGQTITGFDETLASTAVSTGILTTATPTISGYPLVGHTLKALHGTWGPGTVTFAYQWLRNGLPIASATAASYVPSNADVGSRLTVTVTGSESGYASASTTSTPTKPVTGGQLTTATPTITGTAAVGATLTAHAGTWGPGQVTLHYQWVRGTSPILGANGATYKVVAADRGKTLAVIVLGTKAGFLPAWTLSSRVSVRK